ncbi:glycosyltransferase family 4 protein [Thalassococcus lentus]|uniref:Glycosyltransferase family 4 protein n=1 Tax=Thalassococcus lentus TaxID=1210524 RepID=A0ABT4XTC5_9RHOB|nr:glycosyltransferase family 4 protein [Thalassococcus lentus]MDA7425162.1 glycosyltransferase family 4 protein [Thalassococcus lentus]
MKILLIHQNFPGQYKHLAPALVQQGHEVVALTCKVKEPQNWQGVKIIPYEIQGASTKGIHPWLADFETKILRATSCYRGAKALKAKGFEPDVICAHHGWGESMFLKDVWPNARLGLYCELYHLTSKPFINFDPEFPSKNIESDTLRIRMKNLNNRLHEEVMDAGLSPTRFQASTFPDKWQDRLTVAHDGVDTEVAKPNPDAKLKINDDLTLTRDDEVITFINRNLEPYRGYHVFMRALPEILKRRKNAHVVILGGNEVSYGSKPPKGQTWMQIFIDEVRGRIPTPSWNRVHFMGRVPYDTYLSMIQVSRAHVYLTYPFVLSWSLLESMSAECAIVASGTEPVREVLTEGETGLMVDFFDSNALTDRLCTLLDDEALRKRLGENARTFVQENYDLQTICLPQHLKWVEDLGKLEPRPIID